jgi:hypothetical protein
MHRYKLILALIFLFQLHHETLSGQDLASGNLFEYVNDILSGMPGSGTAQYHEPTESEQLTWISIIHQIIMADFPSAHGNAASLGYRIIEFSDTLHNQLYYILEKNETSDAFWGTYVFNPEACRSQLVIMSPHPKKDLNTGREGIYCFLHADAYCFMLSGTHRCNNDDESNCSGSSSVCTGSSDPYKISDMAHNVNSIWQKTTEILYDSIPYSYFMQLHGFTKKSSDPYVIMSNGTRQTPNPDYLTSLSSALYNEDNVLTFKIAHVDLEWTRLIGFTNTNGRYINRSPNPCSQSASLTKGRFLHIEQEKTRLRQTESGWSKMSNAIIATFPPGPKQGGRSWYVSSDSLGSGCCWLDASGDLVKTLSTAYPGDTICVSTGTYYPTTGFDRNSSFIIPDSLIIFGSFPPGGGLLSERDPGIYPSIMSGDIGVLQDISDNSYHVINIPETSSLSILDGWIIENGNANNGSGGGIFCAGNLTLRNSVLKSNNSLLNGAAVFISGPGALLNIKQCTLFQNTASNNGPAVHVEGGGILKLDGISMIQF